MKTLTLSLALAVALMAGSSASAAVVVAAGPFRVAVGRPAVRHGYVAPRPVLGSAARVGIHNRRENFWGAVDNRNDAIRGAVHERREAFWGAVNAAQQP